MLMYLVDVVILIKKLITIPVDRLETCDSDIYKNNTFVFIILSLDNNLFLL
jgi:hypothetical protein